MTDFKPEASKCSICRETFNPNQTIVALPVNLGHGDVGEELAHEFCALRVGCEHDVKPIAGDPDWGRCAKCGDASFPMTDRAAGFDRAPIPMLLWCPGCGARHIDEGPFAERPHRTHACQACGMVWRPALVDTVGVRFLPGYEPVEEPDEEPPRPRKKGIPPRSFQATKPAEINPDDFYRLEKFLKVYTGVDYAEPDEAHPVDIEVWGCGDGEGGK